MQRMVFVILLLLLTLHGLAEGAEPVRCAVIVDRDEALRSSPLMSLLEVRLSQNGKLALLERDRIDAILAEQQLSLAGVLDPNAAVQVGRLLSADLLVLLSAELSDQEAGLLRVRIAEAAHGFRLWEGYEQIDGGDAPQTTDRIAGRILSAAAKIDQPVGKMVPVGIVDVHRVQMGDRYQWLERALPGLLSARLGAERGLLMLERESLSVLLRERQLTEGEEASFWNSAVLVDGYLQPGSSTELQMHLRLRQAAGRDLLTFDVPVDPEDLAKAIELAATPIVSAISSGEPAGQWHAQREADEFYRQGMLLTLHGRHDDARAPFEAACALAPTNVRYTDTLIRSELAWGARHSRPETESTDDPSYSPLFLAEQVSRFVRQIRDGYVTGSLTAEDVLVDYAPTLMPVKLLGPCYFGSAVSMANEQVRAINRENRRLWAEVCNKALEEKSEPMSTYDVAIRRIELAWVQSDEQTQRMALIKKALNQAILPPALGGQSRSDTERCRLCDQVLLMRGTDVRTGLSRYASIQDGDEDFSLLWDGYLEELMEVEDPLVRLYALMTQIRRMRPVPDDNAEIRNLSERAVIAYGDFLEHLGDTVGPNEKKRICKQLASCFASVSLYDPKAAVILWEKACRPLIEAQDAENLALWFFPFKAPGMVPGSAEVRRYVQLLQQAADVLRSDQTNPTAATSLAALEEYLLEVQPPSRNGNQMLQRSMVKSSGGRMVSPSALIIVRFRIHWEVRKNLLLIARSRDANYQQREALMDVAVIDLATARLVSMQTARYAIGAPPRYGLPVADISVIGDAAFVATPSGILRVGNILSPGCRLANDCMLIGVEDGLPSASIVSVVEDEEKLWVAYGRPDSESGLGLYDPNTGQWQGLLCSALPGDQPFNGGSAYQIEDLTVYNPGRLCFSARSFGRDLAGSARFHNSFWEFNTSSRELTYFKTSWLGQITPMGQKLFLRCRSSLMEFEPARRHVSLLLGQVPQDARLLEDIRGPVVALDVTEIPFLPDQVPQELVFGSDTSSRIDLSTAAICREVLWARFGSTQLVTFPRGATVEQIEIRNNDLLGGEPVIEFVSTPYCLVAVGEHTIGLIGSSKGEDIQLIDTRGVRSDLD